jgi:transposase
MIYAEIKNQEEQKRLDDALKASNNKNWYRRLQVIALSAQKYTVQKLSEMFRLCQATIRNYIHTYNEGGLETLTPKKSPGRPPKVAHWTKEDWDKVLERTPNQYGKLHTQSRQWTLDRLRLYLKEYHGIDVSIVSIYNSLRRTGRRTGRSKLRVGSPDPKYTAKRKHTEDLGNLHLGDN